MTRRALTSIFTAAAVALALPVYAQDKGQAGARPNPSGNSAGSAASRPSGGGGGGSSSGGGAASRPSGGGSSASRPSPDGGSPRGEFRAPSAPERRSGAAASPRSSNHSNGERPRIGARTTGAAASASPSNDNNGDRRRAVPAYARPRDGRPVIGTAVPRTGRPPVDGGGYYYDPYYRYSYYYNRYPYGYYYPGYGLGVGYFYDPWMWGYSSPYYSGGGGYSGSYYSRQQYRDIGAVRLKVKPEHGQVYVDGYYVGEVDSFDGVFQRLSLESGAHRIEVRAEGYAPEQFEVMVIPGETITYKGDLKRVQ